MRYTFSNIKNAKPRIQFWLKCSQFFTKRRRKQYGKNHITIGPIIMYYVPKQSPNCIFSRLHSTRNASFFRANLFSCARSLIYCEKIRKCISCSYNFGYLYFWVAINHTSPCHVDFNLVQQRDIYMNILVNLDFTALMSCRSMKCSTKI